MSERVTERGFKRREFMSYALALGSMTAAASVVGPSRVWGAVDDARETSSICPSMVTRDFPAGD
jgi:hypothetical protein